MKSSDSKVIIFDDSCPMCRLYTLGFVAVGALKKGNRVGFAEVDSEILEALDQDRARHEIPLFDRETRETMYGLDALLYLLGARFPWLTPVTRTKTIRLALWPLYQFITYNRRVMAGCASKPGFCCAPDLHRVWRVVYLAMVMILIGWFWFGQTWGSWGWASGSESSPLVREWFWGSWMLTGWLLGMGLLGLRLPLEHDRWDWFGNLGTMGLLFSFVAFGVGSWGVNGWWSSFSLGLGLLIMGVETYRRLGPFLQPRR